jgi:hypothetical protein
MKILRHRRFRRGRAQSADSGAYACGCATGLTRCTRAGADRAGRLRLGVVRVAAEGQGRSAPHLPGPGHPRLAARAGAPGLRAGGVLLRARRDHRPGTSVPAANGEAGAELQRQPALPRGADWAEGRGSPRARHVRAPQGTRRRLQRPREGPLHDPRGQVHGVAPAPEHQERARSSSILCLSARRLSRRSCASRSRRFSSLVTASIGGTSVGLPSSSRATIVR